MPPVACAFWRTTPASSSYACTPTCSPYLCHHHARRWRRPPRRPDRSHTLTREPPSLRPSPQEPRPPPGLTFIHPAYMASGTSPPTSGRRIAASAPTRRRLGVFRVDRRKVTVTLCLKTHVRMGPVRASGHRLVTNGTGFYAGTVVAARPCGAERLAASAVGVIINITTLAPRPRSSHCHRRARRGGVPACTPAQAGPRLPFEPTVCHFLRRTGVG